jgi:hypothetical protein
MVSLLMPASPEESRRAFLLDGLSGGTKLVGRWVWRPDRVWVAWGAYSSPESETEWGGEWDARSCSTSESAKERLRFREAGCVSERVEADFGFLGPRLMPGRPRPSPFPELTISPLGRT